MELKKYQFQEDAVDWLMEKSLNNTSKRDLVLRAPTGSGKTAILLKYIDSYFKECPEKVAFVWLCPGNGELEEQSRREMMNFFPNRPTADLDDVLCNGFEEGTTVFINWEKITRIDNKALLSTERDSIYKKISLALSSNIKFIVIIDEEHLHDSKKARDFVSHFVAQHIIRVSATTVARVDDIEFKQIKEEDVINEKLITKAISVNEAVPDNIAKDDSVLVKLAHEKRQELYNAYRSLGKKINPLVLIQFPNADDEKIKEVEQTLRDLGCTRQNGRVAAWLSNDKDDVPNNVTDDDCELSFLFIKQAINTGWNCPRAKILVKLREGSDEDFDIQTVGRIRRMPEKQFYSDEKLNLCYVYTFDEKFSQGLMSGVDKAYKPKRLKLKEKCKDFIIPCEIKDNNISERDNKEVLINIYNYYMKKYSLERNDFEGNKRRMKDYEFRPEIYGKYAKDGLYKYTDTLKEVSLSDSWTPIDSKKCSVLVLPAFRSFKNLIKVDILELKRIFEVMFSKRSRNSRKILSLNNIEFCAFIVNNYAQIKKDLEYIAGQVYEQNSWINPPTRKFKFSDEEVFKYDESERDTSLMTKNAFEGYTRQFVTKKSGRSLVEIKFEEYCEKSDNVDWVYKNGDCGKDYLSIVYYNYFAREQIYFYPDYIVKMTNGDIWIIETKGGQTGNKDNNIDIKVENKFISFKRYAKNQKINWGFVRDVDGSALYLNNTEYFADMHNEHWRPISEFF